MAFDAKKKHQIMYGGAANGFIRQDGVYYHPGSLEPIEASSLGLDDPPPDAEAAAPFSDEQYVESRVAELMEMHITGVRSVAREHGLEPATGTGSKELTARMIAQKELDDR